MSSIEISLTIFCILLVVYIVRLKQLEAKKNKNALTHFIKGFVDHSTEISKKSALPVNLDESLIILFKNLKTTHYLFEIIAKNNNPIQEQKLFQAFRQVTTTENLAISEMAFKASVHLLMVANLVAFDINEGLKVTAVGRELFSKI